MNGAGEEGEGGDVGKHFTVSWSLLNAHCPISITLWGIVTEVNARHNWYLQPIITQYFIDNKSEIWLLFLIAHSKR